MATIKSQGMMRRIRLVVILMLVVLASTLIVGGARPFPPPKKQPDALDRILGSTFFHGLPLKEASDALKSRDAIERLVKILEGSDRADLWENATLLLGFSGNMRAFQELLDFFHRDDSAAAQLFRCGGGAACKAKYGAEPSQVVSSDVYYSKANVPTAVGLWVHEARLQDVNLHEAVKFLEECADPRVRYLRDEIKWHAQNYNDQEFMYADLITQCVEGLGISGSSDAGKYLLAVEKHLPEIEGTKPELRPRTLLAIGYPAKLATTEFFQTYSLAVRSASKTNDVVAKKGLAAYYAQTK